jgi:Zn-dependent protease
MFGHRFRILRLLGIPVSLDPSWLIILALVTWTLINYFQQTVPDLASPSYLVLGLIAALAFFTCILLHEMGHALVARVTGTPVRGINQFLFGGVSELEGEPSSAGREFVMAIAGPAVSAVLATAFAVLAVAGEIAEWAPALIAVLGYLAWINLMLLLFNLVPAFPLDGGRYCAPSSGPFSATCGRPPAGPRPWARGSPGCSSPWVCCSSCPGMSSRVCGWA